MVYKGLVSSVCCDCVGIGSCEIEEVFLGSVVVVCVIICVGYGFFFLFVIFVGV